MLDSPILIVAHREAQEVDGVIDCLRDRGTQIERWNLCEYPERLAATISREMLRVGDLHQASETFASAAWLHEFGSFTVIDSLDGVAREVAVRESEAFWEGILSRLRCRWLNHPGNIRTSSNKLLQLRVAEDIGIPVPDYCSTNDASTAMDFVESKKRAVIKAVRGGYIPQPPNGLKFFTKRANEFDQRFYNSLRYGPIIVQEEIDRQREIRITVVDESCFCMEIDCADLQGVVDIRELDFETERGRFRRATNVAQLENWSRSIVHELGLGYAGLDWAISVSGRPFFLECNPLGSFKWSEISTGLDITSAIANALIRRACGE